MVKKIYQFGCILLCCTLLSANQSIAKTNTQSTEDSGPGLSPFQPAAKTVEIPKQILKTHINLNSTSISPNSAQLAESIGILSILKKIQNLRKSLNSENGKDIKMDLTLYIIDAMQILQETNFAIDFVLAEILAEQNMYASILNTYEGDRDKTVFKVNAISFIANGALWALAESLNIPTYNHPMYSISSGTTGILAGIIPSVASVYALHLLKGKNHESESDPNMLAKLFDYPADPEVEYPKPVWQFLNSVPPESTDGRTRRDELINRWITDKNIPHFTDKSSARQLDVLTASAAQRKGLSISTLNARQKMLHQLSAEVMKMKRMLLELSMVVRGEKNF